MHRHLRIMKKDQLLPLLKFYKGETDVPENFTPVQQLWWEGEKLLVENVERDPVYFSRLLDLYREAFNEQKVLGRLADTKINENKRVIIFFLDIWHGRNYPYDSLDLINEYYL